MGAMDAESAMATTQPLMPSASNSSITCSRGCVKLESSTPSDPFPAGLRVLVVDDDPICLLILDRMLRRCLYQVTTCEKATDALEMLREKRDSFDLVISDVYMPDMDGFKLLELVGLEMDLPVIMMSANGETSAVMKGIKHGACDYLLKPVRIEELRNIWQHVVRKKWRSSEQAASREDDRHQRVADDSDYTSSANEGFDGVWNKSKKRKDIKEEDEDVDDENDDPSTTKKPRVVWSVDLHQQFVAAVNQLGIDKAVPKRILELMNVQGLTRENVASHLQKYRLYLKRISGVAHQPGGLNSSFAGSPDSNFGAVGAGGLGGLSDLRTLAATGQLSPQALVSLQAGLLGRLGQANNLGLGSVDPSLLLAALQGASSGALTRPSYSQPLLCNQQGNFQAGGPSELKQFAQASQQLQGFGQMAGSPSGMSSLQQQQQQLAGAVGLGGMGQHIGVNNNMQINPNNNALMMQVLQQQGVGHSTSGGVSALPSGGTLGQHGIPAEMGAWANSLSNVNGTNAGVGTGVGVQTTSLMRQGPASNLGTGSSSPNILGSLGRSTCADSKGLQIPNVGNSNPLVLSPMGVSSPLHPTGLDSDLGASRIKSIGSSLGAVNEGSPQTLSSFASNFISPPGLKHGLGLNTNQRSRTGSQGFGLCQEFGHTNSPVPSPRYSQASSNSQGLNIGSGQEHGLRAPVFGTGFPGNLGMDGLRMKASAGNVSSQSEQSTADSDLKGKESSLGLLMVRKAEHGLLPEPSPEDLLSMFLKQQQEGLGLSESDLAAAEGYQLDNI